MSISERIRLIISRDEKLTAEVISGWLGITPTRVRQKLKEGIWDSLSEITTISDMTGYACINIHGDQNKKPKQVYPSALVRSW